MRRPFEHGRDARHDPPPPPSPRDPTFVPTHFSQYTSRGPFAHGREKSCMLRLMNEARSFSRSARLRPDRLIALLRMTVGESLRSKRFIMLALLQTLGGTLTMLVFIQSLTALEKQIAQQLGVGEPEKPGALIAEVMHSPDAQEFLRSIA